MILLTPEIRAQLEANGRDPEADHLPVAKLFNPLGPGVWLATHLDGDGDTLWGIADLDLDCVEYGTFSHSELQGLAVGLGLGIERDILFKTRTPLSVWLATADDAGGIRSAERIIARLERESRSILPDQSPTQLTTTSGV
ncbi:MAG: single-stranded DNA endonuclease [Alphaproteobacteria bacterium HGW-Alphaproteobacteria-16]|nr:MAG: single-stranded DNA endonuclease [Alphaproteobacteria bacterium HGW-Alphaproteobacteria-16]